MKIEQSRAHSAGASADPATQDRNGAVPREPLGGVCASVSISAVQSALERAFATLPSSLERQRDALTGMYLRNFLYSEQGRAEIALSIPGPKRFILFDCQHAGAANTYGDGKRIDKYFQSLNDIFERTAAAHGIPIVAMRLGGDEFALIVPAEKRSTGFLHDVIGAIEQCRRDNLGPGSNELGEYVVTRNIMRALRNDYRRHCEHFGESISLEGFHRHLEDAVCHPGMLNGFEEYLKSTGANLVIEKLMRDSLQRDIGPAIRAGFFQKYLATTHFPLVHEPAGRFSVGVVELGDAPSWADYHIAEGVASKRIQATKDRPFVLEMSDSVPLDRELKVKAHEQAAQLSFQSRVSRYNALWNELSQPAVESPELRAAKLWEVVNLAVTDPNLPGALRAGLLGEIPAEAVLGKGISGPLYALTVDVKSFGVVNNSLSYSEADAMLGQLLSEAQRHFPATAVLRHGGGKVTLLGSEPLTGPKLAELRDSLSQQCQQFIRSNPAGFKRIALEFGERVALKTCQKEAGGHHLPPIDLGVCDLAMTTVLLEPGAPLPLL